MKARLLNILSRKKNPRSVRGARTFRLQPELLEERRMLASVFTPLTGQLFLYGTDDSDDISVRYQEADNPASPVIASIRAYQNGTRHTERATFTGVTKIFIYGQEGDDWLLNNTDIDAVLAGGNGTDQLKGGGGDDVFNGGAGSDFYLFTTDRADLVTDGSFGTHSTLGRDRIVDEFDDGTIDVLNFMWLDQGITIDLNLLNVQTIVPGLLELEMETGLVNWVYGTMYDDTIRGNHLDNYLFGGMGNDVLEGRGGDDYLHGSIDRTRYVFGGSVPLGRDTILSSGIDTLDFSGFARAVNVDLARDDVQVVSAGYLELEMLPHGDISHVVGTPFGDVLRGNELNNVFQGLEGNDVMEGRGGNDTMIGHSGDDSYVFSGSQVLGSDTIFDSDGVDTLDFRAYGRAVHIDLVQVTNVLQNGGGYLNVRLALGAGIENVYGTPYRDVLYGNDLNNTLWGMGSDDRLYGRGGSDTLFGGQGNDELYGGSGLDRLFGEGGNDRLDGGRDGFRDELTGGTGIDAFVIHTPLNSEQIVTDFIQGTDSLLAG